MTMVCWSSEREAGIATGCYCGATGHHADLQRRRWCCGACVAAMLITAVAQAEDLATDADSSASVADTFAASPIDVDIPAVLAALIPPDAAPQRDIAAPASTIRALADERVDRADGNDLADLGGPAQEPASHTDTSDILVAAAPVRRWRVHATDATDATSGGALADPRIRAFSLALDAVLPRSGITIQPRVQMAWRPSDDGRSGAARAALAAMPPDAGDTGLALRVYGARPSPAAGVYPFVEADWWQDSRRQTININGTRIDADLLRGLLSFNVGAHGSTRSGVKVWVKIKTGRNAGGIIGARYRW